MLAIYMTIRVFFLVLATLCGLMVWRHRRRVLRTEGKRDTLTDLVDMYRIAGDAKENALALAHKVVWAQRLYEADHRFRECNESLVQWLRRRDRFKSWFQAMGKIRGQAIPYTLGAIDVASLLYVVDRYLIGGQELLPFLQRLPAYFTLAQWWLKGIFDVVQADPELSKVGMLTAFSAGVSALVSLVYKIIVAKKTALP